MEEKKREEQRRRQHAKEEGFVTSGDGQERFGRERERGRVLRRLTEGERDSDHRIKPQERERERPRKTKRGRGREATRVNKERNPWCQGLKSNVLLFPSYGFLPFISFLFFLVYVLDFLFSFVKGMQHTRCLGVVLGGDLERE